MSQPFATTGTHIPHVHLIHHFHIPQLHRHRRIWVYLPPTYGHGTQHYPVVYMMDGQNLFDPQSAYAGSWHIAQSMDHLQYKLGFPEAIVIGIDNGGADRIHEYSAWPGRQGGGQAPQFADFIIHTLKPYIDSHYRTMWGREYTAIMGSSMGGLFALYAGLRHQEVFSLIGSFSPSLWFNKGIYALAEQPKRLPMKVAIVGSKSESRGMEGAIHAIYWSLRKGGFYPADLWVMLRERGRHNERFWGREFRNVYKQLFPKVRKRKK